MKLNVVAEYPNNTQKVWKEVDEVHPTPEGFKLKRNGTTIIWVPRNVTLTITVAAEKIHWSEKLSRIFRY